MQDILPYVFWIDHSEARRKFIDLLPNCPWAKFYTLDSVDDALFRFHDLQPLCIILEYQTMMNKPSVVETFLEQTQAKFIIASVEEVSPHWSQKKEYLGHYLFPIDPKTIWSKLEKLRPISSSL